MGTLALNLSHPVAETCEKKEDTPEAKRLLLRDNQLKKKDYRIDVRFQYFCILQLRLARQQAIMQTPVPGQKKRKNLQLLLLSVQEAKDAIWTQNQTYGFDLKPYNLWGRKIKIDKKVRERYFCIISEKAKAFSRQV